MFTEKAKVEAKFEFDASSKDLTQGSSDYNSIKSDMEQSVCILYLCILNIYLFVQVYLFDISKKL